MYKKDFLGLVFNQSLDSVTVLSCGFLDHFTYPDSLRFLRRIIYEIPVGFSLDQVAFCRRSVLTSVVTALCHGKYSFVRCYVDIRCISR
ncbi:hypothetical protein CEXT_413631 [Caerostris extrusa]|uniref:Uncharacterized protein n=1 Tax=Caerostris extrusa TaxID=172846 RepID=A0AAV4NDE5_CAEEX|nr:hypothetical protein CEXT_413631 [Caerostris extrusa]